MPDEKQPLLPASTAHKSSNSIAKTKPRSDASLTFGGAIQALLCTAVGTGVVASPRMMAVAGWGAGAGLISLAAALTVFSLHFLFRCARVHPDARTYQALVQRCLPRGLGVLVEFSLAAIMLGGIGATLLLAKHVFRSVELVSGTLPLSEVVVNSCLLLAAIPLCLPRNFADLQWVSFINFTATIGTVALMCIHMMRVIYSAPLGVTDLSPAISTSIFTSPSGALTAFPMALYVFFCQINAPQLFSELSAADQESSSWIGVISSGLACCIYLAVGLSGYAIFGAATESDIMLQLSANSPTSGILLSVRSLFGLMLLLSVPLMMTPLRMQMLEKAVFPLQYEDVPFNLHFTATTFILVSALLLAVTVPWIDLIMEILGATCVAFLALTVPGLLTLKCCQDSAGQLGGYFLVAAGSICTPLTLGAVAAKHTGYYDLK